jgi:hypothetical protein
MAVAVCPIGGCCALPLYATFVLVQYCTWKFQGLLICFAWQRNVCAFNIGTRPSLSIHLVYAFLPYLQQAACLVCRATVSAIARM